MKRPARILFTIPNFTTAGSGQAMVNIIDRLDRSLFEPTVAVLKSGGELTSRLEASGVEVVVAPFTVEPRPYASLAGRVRAASATFRGRFHLWHSFHYGDDYTEPLIARASGAGWIFTKKNMSWGSRAWWLRALLARRIGVQNLEMLDEFFSSPLLRPKCRYIPRGIDVDRWAAATGAKWRHQLGLGEAHVLIACVGHIQPRKNQLRLVDAMRSVPDAHLVLAGRELDTDYANQIRRLVETHNLVNRVHLVGEVTDVAALLAASDVFGLVSHAEGSPVAMLEGMACGLPGVYASVGGIKEIVDDGRNGLLVDPRDVESMTKALTRLVESTAARRSMGAEAQLTARRAASLDIEVARHQSLYLEALRR